MTNVPEICMWYETYNNVYGRTNNPYHLGRMVGGSSGGEVAVIAAAASVIGVSTENDPTNIYSSFMLVYLLLGNGNKIYILWNKGKTIM